jgi:hypothetical protein
MESRLLVDPGTQAAFGVRRLAFGVRRVQSVVSFQQLQSSTLKRDLRDCHAFLLGSALDVRRSGGRT